MSIHTSTDIRFFRSPASSRTRSVKQGTGQGAAVVLGCHGFPIGTGAPDGKQVAAAAFRKDDTPGEHVGALADRADHVVLHPGAVGSQVVDPVVGMVQRRADKVGHARVQDGEALVKPLLDIQDPGNQGPAGGHDAAPELEMDGTGRGQMPLCRFIIKV